MFKTIYCLTNAHDLCLDTKCGCECDCHDKQLDNLQPNCIILDKEDCIALAIEFGNHWITRGEHYDRLHSIFTRASKVANSKDNDVNSVKDSTSQT